MRPRTLVIATAASLALGLIASCSEPVPQGITTQAVINGDPSTDPEVVALVDGGGWFCSGAVISAHVVLTAAHCLEGAPPTGVFFGTNANNEGSGIVIPVAQTLIHPEYPQKADIGLIELAEAATVAPAVINRMPLTANMAGDDVRVVGFGLSEDNGDAAGVKLTGLTTFDSLEEDYMLVRPQGQQSGCYGDSGGPNYMQLGGSGEVLAGVTSFGTEDSCLAGFGGNTDVEKYADWIDVFVEEIDGAPVDPGPSCTADGECVADCSTPDPDCDIDDPGPGDDDDDDDDTDGDDDGGAASSGCSAGGGGQGAMLALALLAFVRRRRFA